LNDATPAPAFGPRMVRTICGIVNADARTNGRERSGLASLTGYSGADTPGVGFVPFNPRYSAEWSKVQEEEARAQRERQEREAAEREAKALENYHGPRWREGERVL
jgi:hypothetical protein